jgi:hypothetical protein
MIAGSSDGLCAWYARDYRSMDFIPALGFVTFGSIPRARCGALKTKGSTG